MKIAQISEGIRETPKNMKWKFGLVLGLVLSILLVSFSGCVETEPTPVTPTVHDIEEITISPATQSPGTIDRHYEWWYGGVKWTWNLSLPESLYEYYRDKPRPPTGDYSVYVTHPYDDVYIEMLAGKLNAIAVKQGFTRYETVNFAVAFVHSLPYTADNVTTPFDEYPRYPLETLVDNGGDCEDTSILTAALLDKMGYDVVLIYVPGHMAVGVLGGEGVYGTYYLENGKKYFYLETTGEGWKIGQIPNEYKGSPATLYHLVPRPILTLDWTATRTRSILTDIVTLTVTVENVGTAMADNAYVYAAFDAGENYVYSPVESETFSLVPGGGVIITLFLDVPRDVSTRLIVRAISGNYLMDKSTSEWFQT